MSQGRMLQRISVLLTAVSVVILLAAGCDSGKKIDTLQKDNQALTQRVAELEGQLRQAESAVAAQSQAAQAQTAAAQPVQEIKNTIPTATAAAPVEKTPAGHSTYVVKEGDNLWKIAKKQLGNGARYKEILTLNPHITKDKPLIAGAKLTLPAK